MSEKLARPLLGLAAAAATAPLLAAPSASARPHAKVVRVTATDTAFRLSAAAAPAGKVTFVVRNAGKRRHAFLIAGKRTRALAPGASARLAVAFARGGIYAYRSPLPGDVRRGLKGAFRVNPKVMVSVRLTDRAIRLSRASVPVGQVGFAVRNAGKRPHSFRIAGKRTPVLAPRRAATLIVTLRAARKYPYVSTVKGDVRRGLRGVLVARKPATGGGGGGGGGATAGVAAGKTVFAMMGCGSCHTLRSAGAVGTVGPDLDRSHASRALIVARVTKGKGAMPSYEAQLSAKQISDLADFILATRGR